MNLGTYLPLSDEVRENKMVIRMLGSTFLIFLFFFSLCGQAWSGGNTFFQDVDPGKLETALTSPDIVTRIRPVIPNLAILTDLDQGELVFNCFDDALVTVSVVKQDRKVNGQTLWLGTIKGVAHSYVLLVSNNETVSGEITGPDVHYQIRPWQEGIHIVREMVKELSFDVVSKLTGSISFENQVVVLTNQERAANSLQAYNQDAKLTISARGHATDMAANDYFSHTGLDGSSMADRITDAGYIWNAVGENIAAGQTTSTEVVTAWMNSQGHRDNILSSTYCDIGVGYAFETSSTYYHYWVQNFGRKLGVSVCPQPSTPPPPPSTPGGTSFPVGVLELILLDNSK